MGKIKRNGHLPQIKENNPLTVATSQSDDNIPVDHKETRHESGRQSNKKGSHKRCLWCRLFCHWCTLPLRTEQNPLPSSPSFCERFKFAFLCPPHGRVGGFLFLFVLFFTWWGVLIAVTDKDALPGGNLFSLLILFISCWIGGYLMTLIRLPALLGMLVTGIVVNNIPQISFGRDTNHAWSANIRQIALTVILIRAGLGLDPKALRRLSFVVLRLAFSPCLVEMLTIGIAAHFVLEFPWTWGFMLGFVLAAVSPGVVVPCLLSLQQRGYGVDKGIPTLIIAAASIDDVLAITGFGLVLGLTFTHDNVVWSLFKGPVEAMVGLSYGLVMGITLWYIPHKSSNHLVLFRSSLLVGLALLAILLSIYLEWSGAGPLGCLSLAFVAALKWRKEVHPDDKHPIDDVVGVLWMIFQPLLFGLIGAAVDISVIEVTTIARGIYTLCIGLAFRMVVSFLVVLHTKLILKERLFVVIAWIPKATVQAAIGGLALDQAIMRKDNGIQNAEEIKYGEQQYGRPHARATDNVVYSDKGSNSSGFLYWCFR
ncbi:sodium/hydrogen exchanger 9B2-like isoform X2 [Gigantopelta aegis]|uniref:sodium/hydrogen exchanger 9B2-like isoform X2 n=1 Tax=Gigantopelta aegis TaxID=1735272 RepID=UPI001B88A90E|nr:sodium/hydrogen exchanger 9B2-like isoform X2 [Gigantopelta aegis]